MWDSDVVVRQIMDQCLYRRYVPRMVIVGTDAKYGMMLVRMLPGWVLDLLDSALTWNKPLPRAVAEARRSRRDNNYATNSEARRYNSNKKDD